MAVLEYTAKDAEGNRFSGVCSDIDSTTELRENLNKMGDTLLKAKWKKSPVVKRVKISRQDIATFAYKFAGMLSAGLSIVRSLEALEEQTQNRPFRRVISDVRQSVATGSTLKDAFEKQEDVFPALFIGMIEAGESGGKLSETIKASAVYIEKQADFRHKIKSAFAYPVVVGIMSIVVVSCLVMFIVPVFSKLYQQMHVELPGPTKLLITLSVVGRGYWWAILPLITVAVFVVRTIPRARRFKVRWDAFKLKMPVFSELNRMVVASSFVRTFAMLVSAGIPLTQALAIASRVVGNARLSEVARDLQESVKAGNPIASSLMKYDIFPPVVVQLASCGEESGKLSEMLDKGTDLLDKDIDRKIKSMLVKIEPAMTVIMGVAVGFVLLAVYLPMFDYMSHLK
ncbi:MAG: type II secretion system F family protein [Sedimentisphaerales bacterium]|nr:type II secretion system F family protein [Sedimentisphaerales bacterium]